MALVLSFLCVFLLFAPQFAEAETYNYSGSELFSIMKGEGTWGSVGVGEGEKGSWEDAGFTPATAKPWLDAGFRHSEIQIFKKGKHLYAADLAVQLRDNGFKPEQAGVLLRSLGGKTYDLDAAWATVKLPIEEMVQWIQADFEPKDAIEWYLLRLSADEVRRANVGGRRTLSPSQFTPVEIQAWRDEGLQIEGLFEWKAAGFSASEAMAWVALGKELKEQHKSPDLSPNEATHWKSAGMTSEQAKLWLASQMAYDQAKPWIQAEFSVDLAKQWIASEVEPSDAAELNKQKVNPSEKKKIDAYLKGKEWELAKENLSPEALKQWEASGLSAGLKVKLKEAEVPTEALPVIKNECAQGVKVGDEVWETVQDPYNAEGECYLFGGKQVQRLDKAHGLYKGIVMVHLTFTSKIVPPFIAAVVKGGAPYNYVAVRGNKEIINSGKVIFLYPTNREDSE